MIGLPDVFSEIDRTLGIAAPAVARRAAPAAGQMTPEEEASFLAELGSAALGGVAKVGYAFDTPGGIVRDILGGGDVLSNVINPTQRTTGRQLLEQRGWLGPNQEGFDWGDVLGLAAEIGLDPLTYLTFGSSAVSKVARAAGLADDAARIATRRLGRYVGPREARILMTPRKMIDFPGEASVLGKAGELLGPARKFQTELYDRVAGAAKAAGEPLTNVLDQPIGSLGRFAGVPFGQAGGAAEKVARGMDLAGRAVSESAPIRMVKGFLAPSAMEQFSKEGQRLAKNIYPGRRGAKATAAFTVAKLGDDVRELYGTFDSIYGPQLRAGLPGDVDAAAETLRIFDDAVRHVAERPNAADPIDEFLGVAGKSLARDTKADQAIRSAAAKLSQAKNIVYQQLRQKGIKIGEVLPEHEFGVSHFPRYVEQIAGKDTPLSALIAPRSGAATASRAGEIRDVPTAVVNRLLTDDAARGADAAKHIQNAYGKFLNPKYDGGISQHAADLAGWVKNHGRRNIFGQYMKPAEGLSTLEDLQRYLRSAHLLNASSDAVQDFLLASAADGGRHAISSVLDHAGFDATAALKHMARQSGLTPDQIGRLTVTDDVAAAVGAQLDMFRNPARWSEKFGGLIDKMNATWRGAFTLPWPAFHARNLASGQYVNLSTGLIHGPQDVAAYTRAVGLANQIRKQADHPLMREAAIHDLPALREFTHGFQDVSAAEAKGLLDMTARVPGLGAVSRGGQKVLDVGGKMMRWVEFNNQMPLYIYLREKGYQPLQAVQEVVKRHFDYGELTQFERAIPKRGLLFYCVPAHAEALTQRGWKRYDELVIGEPIATYNVELDCIEWQPCLDVAAFEHDQPLMVWQSKRHRLAFTAEHRWPVRRPAMMDTNIDGKQRRYPESRSLVHGAELNTNHWFICAAPLVSDFESLLTPDEARLLGWIVTDGTVQQKKPSHFPHARIYQHPKKFLDEVRQVAGGTEYSAHPETGVVAVAVARNRLERLLPYLDKSHLPSLVTQLGGSALQAMYDAMYKADGTTVSHRHQDAFASQHAGVREAFQIICTLLGKRCTQNQKGCYISDRRHMGVKDGALKHEHYKGVVWCPRTDNGTWIMRQGNTIVCTGNTFTRKMAPLMVETLLERPGGVMAQTIKATAKARGREQGPLPEYIEQTAFVPLGRQQDGTTRYLTGFGLPYEDVLDFAGSKKPGVGGLFENVFYEGLSRATPLIKTPTELAFGESLFQRGRPLDELDPGMGRIGSNLRELFGGEVNNERATPLGSDFFEYLAANSPMSRAISTVRTATDPRKLPSLLGGRDTAVVPSVVPQLLTGVRINDVSPRVQDAIVRERAADLLKQLGGKQFERTYFPKAKLEKLTPQQRAAVVELQALLNLLASRAKERKANQLTMR